MAKIYGKVDSLEQLLSLFEGVGVSFLTSLDEITLFKQNYETKIQEIERQVKNDLYLEIEKGKARVLDLANEYERKLEERGKILKKEKEKITKQLIKFSKKNKNIFKKVQNIIKSHFLKKRKNFLTKHFEREKKQPLISLNNKKNAETKHLKYLENNTHLIEEERVAKKAEKIINAKNILDENHSLFLGAIGEQKAVNELKKLPDTFTVINGFNLEFDPPIYNKSAGQRIYSSQADHIVVGPPGVFLIETKNWSRDSINNLDFYSPVEQIKRSSFALFCYLNDLVKHGRISLLRDNWGDRKVSVRNILLMVNSKPNKEFQYVKLLTLSEICRYITYFKTIFSSDEVNQITKYLE